MDYKKKYREAQKWIESIYSELSHEQQMEAEAFFPELKDSEDEKMMHQLHSWMKEFGGAEEYTEKVYTWLKSLIEKQGEQEPTDKVEPKFKVGDYIKHNKANIICKIISVNSGSYYVENIETSGRIELFNAEQNFHLWTIQDAKDGDVLACPLPKGCESGEQIFIFKGINSRDYVDNCIEYYCRICEGVFYENENGYMGTTSSPIYPATKEQRDQLEKAMADAGYIWDSKSKRLLSLKAGLNYTQNPAWSEEDEEILRTIISDGLRGAEFDMLQINWLKSLKQRIGWKPSEEQIECLYDAINHYQTNGYPASKLNELYEQMSKIYKL